ncbi:hypothetical protein I3843_15G110300 [Carya illinoinensis]|nr:hypothetical protein I3843_15G110300 [Carya illinoinensis]
MSSVTGHSINEYEGFTSTNVIATKQRATLVEWLNNTLPDVILPSNASDEDLRMCFKETKDNMEGDSNCSSVSSENIKRFLSAMDDLVMLRFEMSDIGSMKSVIECLASLRAQFMLNVVVDNFSLTSLITNCGSPHGDAFSSGHLCQLSGEERQELVSNSNTSPIIWRSNAPIQSLLSIVNGILDESTERKNGEIPNRTAYMLRKVVQEIERCISTRAEHLRTALEEKYWSSIGVIEALTSGSSEESQLCSLFAKTCRKEYEERKKFDEEDFIIELMKETDQKNLELSALKQELEITKKTCELQCMQVEREAKNSKIKLEKRLKELECLSENSESKVKELELYSDSKYQIQEILKAQNSYSEEFNCLGGATKVFSDVQPLIRSAIDGYDVLTGPNVATKENWGVNYRALNYLFDISRSRRSSITYEMGVQMVEIYNEQVHDLLSSGSSPKKYPFSMSASGVMELMDTGLRNTAVGSTALNERSSRSHSVVTIHVGGRDLKTGAAFHGNLHLVDLAGSERVDCSEVTGDRLREAQHINKSLSALGDVIFALAQKSPHVPYRNSKLTQLLQSSLGGQAKTLMFVQLNPDINSYSEIELGAAWSSRELKDVRELMEQVASLKETIAKKDGEIERLQLLKDLKNLLKNPLPDHDNSSELKHSEADSQQSVDDLKCQNELLRQSKTTRALSDISDGGLSMETDTDGSAENAEGRKSSDHLEK